MRKFDNAREEWFQDPPYNLVDLYEEGLAKFADRPCLGVKNHSTGDYEWVTHGQIAERVAHLRGGLAQIGIGKDDVVGIILNNSVEYPVIAHAAYSGGPGSYPCMKRSCWQPGNTSSRTAG